MGSMSLLGRRIYWRFSVPVAQAVARLRGGAGGLFAGGGMGVDVGLRPEGSNGCKLFMSAAGIDDERFYKEIRRKEDN